MAYSGVFTNKKRQLIIPVLGPFYARVAQPMAWSLFRCAIGGLLVLEGLPKIMAPFAQAGFVEGLGLYPGWFWSPLLAFLEFFGGVFIAAGLFTRPFAFANGTMLAITLWFHYTHPYGAMFLTPKGIEMIQTLDQQLFTPEGIFRLKDGGQAFLEEVQIKAEFTSWFWTGGAFIFAAFGGGYLSLDRMLFRKHF